MASFLRNVVKLRQNALSLNLALRGTIVNKLRQPVCCIYTSNKTKDAVTVSDKLHEANGAVKIVDTDQNWISYGYNLVDREEDEWAHHMLMFCAITVVICWGSLILAYYPDFKDVAWAQREAYLELARREEGGLPLIDANLIESSRVVLPSDEELGDFEIII